jgi:hypothetical protein
VRSQSSPRGKNVAGGAISTARATKFPPTGNKVEREDRCDGRVTLFPPRPTPPRSAPPRPVLPRPGSPGPAARPGPAVPPGAEKRRYRDTSTTRSPRGAPGAFNRLERPTVTASRSSRDSAPSDTRT